MSTQPNADRYNEFFCPVVVALCEKHRFTVGRKTNANSGRHFDSGYGSSIRYEARLAQGNKAKVALHIDSKSREWNIQLVDHLLQRREKIESALGPLDWEQEKDTRRRRVEITRPGSISDDEDMLLEIREWVIEHIVKCKQVFDPHLKELVSGKEVANC